MNEYVVFGTLITIVSVYAAYCIVEYLIGLTPAQRAKGLDRLVDLALTVVGIVVIYVLYTKLPAILHVIGNAIGVQVPDQDTLSLTECARKYFTTLFDRLVNFQRAMFILVTVLGTVPYTVPISVYISHSTQYLQWMMHWSLINVGLYRILSSIAMYSREMLLLGLILSIPSQTRLLGSALCGLSLALPSLVILAWRWCLATGILQAVPGSLSLNNALNAAKTIVLGGYELGSRLQELNVILDTALGMSLAISYGLGQVVGRTANIIRAR